MTNDKDPKGLEEELQNIKKDTKEELHKGKEILEKDLSSAQEGMEHILADTDQHKKSIGTEIAGYFDDLKDRIGDRRDEMTGATKVFDTEKEKDDYELQRAKDYAVYAYDFARTAVQEARMANLKAIDAELEYDKKYHGK